MGPDGASRRQNLLLGTAKGRCGIGGRHNPFHVMRRQHWPWQVTAGDVLIVAALPDRVRPGRTIYFGR
jgi:hypothetical protein